MSQEETKAWGRPRTFLTLLFGLLSVGFFGLGLSLAFYGTPLLKHSGLPWWSQKIFYIHLPAAWGGMGGLLLVLIASIAYLRTQEEKWDAFALSAAEVCLVFCTVVMVTGPIWAKPSWGVFWKWEDPRLMSFLALWLILVSYFVLRAYGGEGRAVARASAALGIVGALSVPFVYMSVKLFRSLHPMLKASETDDRIRLTVWVMNLAFFFFFLVVFRLRYQMARQHSQIRALRRRLFEREAV